MTAMRTHIDCCKGCERRHQGCHSTCEDYKKQSAELDELRTIIRAHKDGAKDIREYYKSNAKKRRPKKSTDKVK